MISDSPETIFLLLLPLSSLAKPFSKTCLSRSLYFVSYFQGMIDVFLLYFFKFVSVIFYFVILINLIILIVNFYIDFLDLF